MMNSALVLFDQQNCRRILHLHVHTCSFEIRYFLPFETERNGHQQCWYCFPTLWCRLVHRLQVIRDHEGLTSPFIVIGSCSRDDYHTRSIPHTCTCTPFRLSEVCSFTELWLALMRLGRRFKVRYAQHTRMDSAEMLPSTDNQRNKVNKLWRGTSFPEVASTFCRLFFIHFGEGYRR